MYGVPRPQQPQQPSRPPKQVAIDTIQLRLMAFSAKMIDADHNRIFVTLDSDVTRDLGMDEEQLKELATEIKNRYGVEVSYHRFKLVGQLNTLRLISEYIYKLRTVWE